MINFKIFKAVLMAATKDSKDAVLRELVTHIGNNYDYNDAKAGHVIEMLVDPSSIVTKDKVNFEWIKKNPKLLMYDHEKYLIKNIDVEFIDNIDCSVDVSFDYIEKINEDREDVSYSHAHTSINFNDYPQILK